MKKMWGVKKVFSFMFLVLAISVLLTACGGGGGGSDDSGNNNPPPPSNNATITGTVAGTTVKAFDLSGNEVASSTATGTPKTFSLNVPAGGSYKFYLIENEGTASEWVYALYSDNTAATNVFTISSAVTIDLGFVDTSTGVAVPQNDPLGSGATSGGEDTAFPPSLIKQYTASGDYTYASGTLTLNVTSSDFLCSGPSVGTNDPITVLSITATTMEWQDFSAGIWTRSSGTSGDITGTWSVTEGDTGNSYDLTFNSDYTFSLTGHIAQCKVTRAYSTHFSNEYHVAFYVDDSAHQYDSVTVTGPYISGSLSLTYDSSNGDWKVCSKCFGHLISNTTAPSTPLTYYFTLNSSSGTVYASEIIESFVEPFVTGLSPSGNGVSATPTFLWTGIGSGYSYDVLLLDSNNDTIWRAKNLTTNSVSYTGTPLTSGVTYYYHIHAKDSYENSSVVRQSFTVQ